MRARRAIGENPFDGCRVLHHALRFRRYRCQACNCCFGERLLEGRELRTAIFRKHSIDRLSVEGSIDADEVFSLGAALQSGSLRRQWLGIGLRLLHLASNRFSIVRQVDAREIGGV